MSLLQPIRAMRRAAQLGGALLLALAWPAAQALEVTLTAEYLGVAQGVSTTPRPQEDFAVTGHPGVKQ